MGKRNILIDRAFAGFSKCHRVVWLDERESTRLVLRRRNSGCSDTNKVFYRDILSQRGISRNHESADIQINHSEGNTVRWFKTGNRHTCELWRVEYQINATKEVIVCTGAVRYHKKLYLDIKD